MSLQIEWEISYGAKTIDYEVWMVYGTRKDGREGWFIQKIEKITS